MLEYDDILTQEDLLEAFDTEILNEVYFGKSKELKEIEKLLDQYRKKYMDRYIMVGAAANTDKLLVKINRLFEKQFGFGDFAIYVIDTADLNAFTFALNNRYDVNATKGNLANAKTFKFNKDYDYAVITCIYAGLIFNRAFTTEEILAILLHEIGHNFYAALTTTNAVFSSCQKAINFMGIVADLYKIFASDKDFVEKLGNVSVMAGGYAIASPLLLNAVMKPIVKSIKKVNEHRTEINVAVLQGLSCLYLGVAIIKLFNRIKMFILTLLMPLKVCAAIAEQWLRKVISMVADPIHILSLPNGFRNERTADNFATMYGYGPALTEGLRKMQMSVNSPSQLDKIPAIVPFISCLFDALVLPFRLMYTAIDPHPLEIQRTADQINMLDTELKKSNLDPKVRKRIQKDIDDMNDCLKKFIDTSKSVGSDPDFVKHMVNRIMYNTVDAKSVKDVLFNFDPNGKYKSYDKTLDEIYEQNKK